MEREVRQAQRAARREVLVERAVILSSVLHLLQHMEAAAVPPVPPMLMSEAAVVLVRELTVDQEQQAQLVLADCQAEQQLVHQVVLEAQEE